MIYPIGKFSLPEDLDDIKINNWISEIDRLPNIIEVLVTNLTINELNFPYRPEGWKIKQIVHHLGDSHTNTFIRFKLALTEDAPMITSYKEDSWANLVDGMDTDLTDSLLLIKSLHSKWVKLLKHMTREDFRSYYVHPDYEKPLQLIEALGMYNWHGEPHLDHIKQAIKHRGKF